MEAWMRSLRVELSSDVDKRKFVFGNNWEKDASDLAISVTVNKYMSTLKDEATIKISNLDYDTIIRLIDGKYYNVQVYCGYRNANVTKIFDGGVYYISNKLNSLKTHTCIILCTSKMIAKFGQTKMNLTLNSGINMYSALRFMCKRAGINDANISTQLKRYKLTNYSSVNTTLSQYLENLTKTNTSYITNTDSTNGSTVMMFDANRSNSRVIRLKKESILLNRGYPRLTNEGLTVTLIPTFDFQCGDTVQIDSAILDISSSDRTSANENYANYFNKKGLYMITEIEYELENRGDTFQVGLQCYNRERISNYLGGATS